MIKLLKFTKFSWMAFFIALLASFIMAVSARAEGTPEDKAKKYGITFPIAEFGNCANYSACHTYCEDPINSAVCKAYFKSKGLYKEEVDSEKIVSVAKGELGCDSASSCEIFCQKAENHDKCNAFVDKHENELGIKGGYVKDPKEMVSKAKEVLGCDSASSCRAFCSQDANKQKCGEFTSQVGARGGVEKKGPGGCNSENTCNTFCSDPANFAECAKFGPPPSEDGKIRSGFKGPGGCDSEDSCRSYCEKNPADCKIVTIGGPGAIDPAKAQEEYKKFCQANPGKCVTPNANPFSSNVGRVEFERFCEANPQKCGGSHEKEIEQIRKSEYERICKENPSKCKEEFSGEGGYVDPGDYCRKFPQRCNRGNNYNPEEMCRQSSNCKWENNTCRCGFYGGSSEDGKKAEEYAKFCRENPDKCRPGQAGGFGNEKERRDFEENCRQNPEKCKVPSGDIRVGRDQQEANCKAGGGYCTWNGDTCGCQRTTTGTSNYMDPAYTNNTAPVGMNRDQQQAACSACGGSCNWNGDTCGCQCRTSSDGSNTSSTSQPVPVQTSAPSQTSAPQPAQTSAPAPQTEQQTQTQQQTFTTSESSGGSSGGGCPAGSYMKDGGCVSGVQGVSTVRNWLDRLLDIFR